MAGGSIAGALAAAALIGVLGARARDRGSVIGVLMPFGLGLGVLFLSLYKGRSANKFGLLTGQIVAIDTPHLSWLLGTSAVVLACLAVMWRPLAFASLDPDVAAARGVPVRSLSLLFMLVLGLAVAVSVQVVGALLVLALLCAAGRGGGAGHRVAGARAGTERGARDRLGGRRDPAVDRLHRPRQPVRHDDLVRPVRGVPRGRGDPGAARLDGPARRCPARHRPNMISPHDLLVPARHWAPGGHRTPGGVPDIPDLR